MNRDDELLASAERFVYEVESAYDDGGYAAGDGPPPPLDEMIWLLDQRRTALATVEALLASAEVLRQALEQIARLDYRGYPHESARIARTALAAALSAVDER